MIVQHPNVYGVLEPAREHFAAAAAAGAKAIQIFDPLSLGVLASPGELGADIAVGEGQVLGNHLNYGGPYLGIIAGRMADVRKLPGRIVGETVDVEGRTGYVLTLQAREQHIRRDKANSNICTNQTLMAIAAAIYLRGSGPRASPRSGASACRRPPMRPRRSRPAGRLAGVPRRALLQGVRGAAAPSGRRRSSRRWSSEGSSPGSRCRRRATTCWSWPSPSVARAPRSTRSSQALGEVLVA